MPTWPASPRAESTSSCAPWASRASRRARSSRLAASLDEVVEAFRSRPLAGPYPYLSLDALAVKVREGGRICSVACVHAVGVSADGRRESLGLDLVTSEDGAGWTAFLRGLVGARPRGRACS